jgi:hypothetical protein
MAERLQLLLRGQQELLANVSHELRTPLARIRVALDLASEGDAAMAREALGEIAEDLGELEVLVADVLRMARLDLAEGRAGTAIPPLKAVRVEPRALLDSSVARFRSAHPERALTLEVPAALPECSGDPVLLRRVVDNLLDNARKYSEADIVLRASHADDQLHLVVEDRGHRHRARGPPAGGAAVLPRRQEPGAQDRWPGPGPVLGAADRGGPRRLAAHRERGGCGHLGARAAAVRAPAQPAQRGVKDGRCSAGPCASDGARGTFPAAFSGAARTAPPSRRPCRCPGGSRRT